MNRQLYNKAGIVSLDAGAPSIKYQGDIKPRQEVADVNLPLDVQGWFQSLSFEQQLQLLNSDIDEAYKVELRKLMGEAPDQQGIMNAMPREMAGLGGLKKAFKKVTGAVKDVVKSDLGKTALLGAATFGIPGTQFSGLGFLNPVKQFMSGLSPFAIKRTGTGRAYELGNLLRTKAANIIPSSFGGKAALGITALGGLTGYLAGQGMDEQQIEEIKSRPEALKTYLRQYYVNLNPELKNQPEKVEAFVNSQLGEYAYAYGGRVKYAKGTDRNQQTMGIENADPSLRAGPDWYMKRVEALMYEYDMDYEEASIIAADDKKYFDLMPDGYAIGGRVKYAMGDTAQTAAGIAGLPYRQNQAGVGEVDLRETGGFIPPVGVKEKADDIPAMLSNNEFVFTADAVRGMGNGNVNLGAQRMYDMMKRLENGGRV